MITYGDYFSRRVLYNCGVSPNQALFHKEENNHTGMQRMETLRLTMTEIYQTLYRGYAQKNTAAVKESFDNLQVERKIVSAFYDSGVLSNAERDYFQKQNLQTTDEREKICVEEASGLANLSKVQKVETLTKMPLTRDVLQ